MIFVYAIICLSKNYIYVGQPDNAIRRFYDHNNGLAKTTKPNSPF
ncbi:MAG: GIY-YIG nuclease family protein [Bacteroidetes bacterium]|nr:GIY-YIG nuclease family protein [Bacteroidota bacterium]